MREAVNTKHVWVCCLRGRTGGEHIEHTQMGVFLVFEGGTGGGNEHVEHARLGMLYVFEGKGTIREANT